MKYLHGFDVEERAFDEFFRSNVPRLIAFSTRYSGLDAASVEDIATISHARV